MYDEFIENLPSSLKSSETFMVKGLKLPLYASENVVAKAIGNYYIRRENLVVFTSPLSGKFTGILEMVKNLQNYVIIVNEPLSEFKIPLDGPINMVFVKEYNFAKNTANHLIFYNTKIPFEELEYKKTHISVFYDYIGVFNPTEYKNHIQDQISYFPDDFIFTILCKYPRQKRVEFVFGTDNSVKHLSISNRESSCFVFCNDSVQPAVRQHFSSQKITVLNKIPRLFKAGKLIFYDIEIDLIVKAIEMIDQIVIIYTKDEFDVLRRICKILQDKEIAIPEAVLRVCGF